MDSSRVMASRALLPRVHELSYELKEVIGKRGCCNSCNSMLSMIVGSIMLLAKTRIAMSMAGQTTSRVLPRGVRFQLILFFLIKALKWRQFCPI
jgi:hypothetical protein